jgi:hypothetical protein
MRTAAQQRERYRGRAWARAMSDRDVWLWQDAMVLGEFDWRDWFIDKPSAAFIAGASDEIEYRDHYGMNTQG